MGNAGKAVSAPPIVASVCASTNGRRGSATGVSEARSQRFAVMGKKTPLGAEKVVGPAEANTGVMNHRIPRFKPSGTSEAWVLVVSV